jgi:hypothetical protein
MNKKNIKIPVEVMEKLADILFQDINFNNPNKIVVEARYFLLGLGIDLKLKRERKK